MNTLDTERFPPARKQRTECLLPLALLSPGEQAVIGSGRPAADHTIDTRSEVMGLRAGRTVEMLINGGSGPFLLKVDESRLAVDRRTGMRILVRKSL